MAHTHDARERRFREYVERLAAALGHADRHEPLRAYLVGLCLPGERKSIEPMAARVARNWVLGPMARHGPVGAWIVDDTAFPKKGQHSVGVARQSCGALGQPE